MTGGFVQEGRSLGKENDARRCFERDLSQYLSFGITHFAVLTSLRKDSTTKVKHLAY